MQDPIVTNTHTVYVTTWESNHGAQKLYKKYGFERVGKIPEYGSDGSLVGYEHIMLRVR